MDRGTVHHVFAIEETCHYLSRCAHHLDFAPAFTVVLDHILEMDGTFDGGFADFAARLSGIGHRQVVALPGTIILGTAIFSRSDDRFAAFAIPFALCELTRLDSRLHIFGHRIICLCLGDATGNVPSGENNPPEVRILRRGYDMEI